jgi:hypothetical protein
MQSVGQSEVMDSQWLLVTSAGSNNQLGQFGAPIVQSVAPEKEGNQSMIYGPLYYALSGVPLDNLVHTWTEGNQSHPNGTLKGK